MMFSAAFDKPVYGEGKYYQPTRRLNTSMYLYVMHTLSPVADNAFPQLLTSLSMAKEKYYQPPGVLVHRCKPKAVLCFSPSHTTIIFLFFLIHHDGNSTITGNVQAGTEHIEHAVNACYQC